MFRCKSKDDSVPHYLGHRKRLKEKFLRTDGAGLGDYELLELLLFAAIPRKDVKPLAKAMLNNLRSFDKIVHASLEDLLKIDGVTKNSVILIKVVKALISRTLKERVIKKNALNSWAQLLDYLKFNMGNLPIEQFRVLFLNRKNVLLADEVITTGTIDQTPVYPREIIKKCLSYNAGAIILVHNHPSGDARPSTPDVDLTNKIVTACKTINIAVHDHVIIGASKYYSFKSNMLL